MDQLFAQFHTLTQLCNDLVCSSARLAGQEVYLAEYTKSVLDEYLLRYLHFVNSSFCQQISQFIHPPYETQNDYSTCCPQRPFPTIPLEFPQAAFLVIQCSLYQCIAYLAAMSHASGERERKENYAMALQYAWIVCRAFSTLHDRFHVSSEEILLCGPALCIAASLAQYSESWHTWIRHKLEHLERAGFSLERNI